MPGIEWDTVGQFTVPVMVALLLDAAAGDPPGRWHPVVWMGGFISWGRRLSPGRGRVGPFLVGCLIVLAGVAGCVAVGRAVSTVTNSLAPAAAWVLEGVILKTTVAARGLAAAAREVRTALEGGDLSGARRALAWHLVSRDTGALTERQVAAAAIESVAENTSDGIIAPLFWFAVGGLPAALAYRFVNTADAMLGYHDTAREWLGKAAARTDDLLNLVPARLTALLVLVLGGRVSAVLVWWRDCRATESPNAGHPMAAAAGVLGLELEKVGAYTLGVGGHPPAAADVRRATRLMWTAALGGGVLVIAAAVGRGMLS